METRANNLIVGLFVLGILGSLLGFVYWMKNDASGPSGKNYHVIFDGSVQGLTESSPVLFNGIRFGLPTQMPDHHPSRHDSSYRLGHIRTGVSWGRTMDRLKHARALGPNIT